MRNSDKTLLALVMCVAFLSATLCRIFGHVETVSADTINKVQGVVPVGTSATVFPVGMGGRDVSNFVRALRVNSDGTISIASVDSASGSHPPLTNGAGILFVLDGAINPGVDTPSRVNVTSNGTAQVTLKAVSGTTTVYVGSLLFTNSGATTHTVTVKSTGGTVVAVFIVPASGTGILGEDGGMYASQGGEGLTFAIDSGGVGTDVSVTGVVYQK